VPVCRVTEQPDIARNPFRHPTIIDLGKLFTAARLIFPDSLKAVRNVSDALFREIQINLIASVKRVALSDAELQSVNPILREI
jgi:hypothetical protein